MILGVCCDFSCLLPFTSLCLFCWLHDSGGLSADWCRPMKLCRCLHTGRARKMKVRSPMIDVATHRQMEVEEVIQIDIKPGWKSGTKVTFPGKGGGKPPADIQFIVEEQSHPRFQRDSNDLIYCAKVSLKDALLGGTLEIEHLDGNKLPVRFAGPVQPSLPMVLRCAPHYLHSISYCFSLSVPTELAECSVTCINLMFCVGGKACPSPSLLALMVT